MRKPDFCIHFVCENKDADQLCGNREADQRLCFRYTDSTISLLPMVSQPGLCQTWSETPKTGFLITRLILSLSFYCPCLIYDDTLSPIGVNFDVLHVCVHVSSLLSVVGLCFDVMFNAKAVVRLFAKLCSSCLKLMQGEADLRYIYGMLVIPYIMLTCACNVDPLTPHFYIS